MPLKVSSSRDPTRTGGLRRKFDAEIRRRFSVLIHLITEGIAKNDAFGLKVNLAPGARAFDFPTSSDKVAAFMSWLNEMVQNEVLAVRPGIPVAAAAQQAWTNTYIESAYQQGIVQGAGQLRRAGARIGDDYISAAFFRPIHADRVGLVAIRTYEELEGVTRAMSQQMSRVLAQGMAEGRNPAQIATTLNDRVRKIGITRARVIARTEIVRAHQQASLNLYREAGVHDVEVEVEVGLGPDPCEVCEGLADNGPYELDEFGRLFPAHPNCVCAPIPRVINATGIYLT